MIADIAIGWRLHLEDHEMVDLSTSHGGNAQAGWWDRIRAAGCEWLHVDFLDELTPFYFDACGFRPTAAGLVRLRDDT